MIKLIHTGDNTHPQDQSIVPISLSTINATVSNPTKPIPELLLLEFPLIVFIFKLVSPPRLELGSRD